MYEPKSIRVLIADDHQFLRVGLTIFLENADGLIKVGEAVNGVQAVEFAKRLRPDVILMDITMPLMDGITATRFIRSSLPSTRIIMLTSSFSSEHRQAAFEAGASAFLVKDVSHETLSQTIKKVANAPAKLPIVETFESVQVGTGSISNVSPS